MVACLPGCKFAVSMIMMFMQKPMSEKDFRQIENIKTVWILGYELVISAYEKQTFDSVAGGNTVVGYTSRENLISVLYL